MLELSMVFNDLVEERFRRLMVPFHSLSKVLSCDNIFDPKQRFAIIADTNIYDEMTVVCKKKPKRLKETFFSSPAAFLHSSYSLIGKEIDEFVKWLIQGGIPQHWYEYYKWHKFKLGQNLEVTKGPRVFTLETVIYGFNLWMIACAISLLGFVAEIVQVLVRNEPKLIG
jgi:hypothetical protein